MLFNSREFIFLFLPITLVIFFVLGKFKYFKAAIAFLVITSLFYYSYWNPVYIFLILSSILFNYFTGILLIPERWNNAFISRKTVLVIGVAFNLGLLAYFKYANFLVDNVNFLFNTHFHIGRIVLPLAISFFTFQQIAYLVDAYRGESKEYNFLHYALFVTFFPQLIAGPIVHHKEMLPQFKKKSIYRFKWGNLASGLEIFLLGLFKKVVFADGIAVYANPVFEAAKNHANLTFFEAWAGVLAYTFQIYFDFSGYSDMAIGIGKMFGINLPINFRTSYQSVNVIEFWRRWHITLSRFLRDYLYIPLGGNRKGTFRRYVNLMVTMLLGGLWHGAAWTFVVWGGLHGIYLMINHAWRNIRKHLGQDLHHTTLVGRVLGRAVTFLAVTVAWVYFRAESFNAANCILRGMMGKNGFLLPAQIVNFFPFLKNFVASTGTMELLGGGTVMGAVEMFGMFLIMFAVIFSLPPLPEMKRKQRAVLLILTFYFTVQAVLFTRIPSEFIYFQF